MMSDRPLKLSAIPNPTAVDPHILAEAIMEQWRNGQLPDARQMLELYPHLKRQRSVVLELAYEEFFLRQESGEKIDQSVFCQRFPSHRASLRRMLGFHQLVDENPSMLNSAHSREYLPKPGQHFNDYRLVSILGIGGFATVYLAEQISVGNRQVALKVSIRPSQEAVTLGQIEHPNIIEVHEAKQDASTGLWFVSMQYRGHATLESLLNEAYPFPDSLPPQTAMCLRTLLEREQTDLSAYKMDDLLPLANRSYLQAILDIAIQIAQTLAFVHGKKIYHCDLKPSNVLLDRIGQPVLLDFNLATSQNSIKDRLGGTIPYMAPEQLRLLIDGIHNDNWQQACHAGVDLYSFGVMVYELLCGQLPFGEISARNGIDVQAGIMLSRQKGTVKPIQEWNPLVPTRLARLIHACLEMDPSKRPASAQQVSDELQAIARRLQPLSRRSRRLSRQIFFGSAVIASLLIAGGLVVHNGRPMESLFLVFEQPQIVEDRPVRPSIEKLFPGVSSLPKQSFDSQSTTRKSPVKFPTGIEEQKLAQREQQARKRLEQDPTNSELISDLAGIECCKSNYRSAADQLTQVLKQQHPERTQFVLLINRAVCFLNQNKLDLAKQDLMLAQRIYVEPSSSDRLFLNWNQIILQFAISLNQQGTIAINLLTELNQILEQLPANGQRYFTAARVFANTAKREALKRGIQKRVDNPPAQEHDAMHPEHLMQQSLQYLRLAQKHGIPRQMWKDKLDFALLSWYPDFVLEPDLPTSRTCVDPPGWIWFHIFQD